MSLFQAGIADPPSVTSISRLLRGNTRRDAAGTAEDATKKDYTINGILGGKNA